MCKLLTASVKHKHPRTMLLPHFVPQRKMPDWHGAGHWTTKAAEVPSCGPCCIREQHLLHPSPDCSVSCSQPHQAALGQQERQLCQRVRSTKTFNSQSQLAVWADKSGGRATTDLGLTSLKNGVLEATTKEEGRCEWVFLSSFLWVWC